MTALRYIAMFLAPTILALILSYLTFPLQLQIQQAAGQIADFPLDNPGAVTRAVDSFRDSGALGIARMLDWVFRLAIVFLALALVYIIPTSAPPARAINLLTVLVLGMAAANLLIGFNYMRWPEFSLYAFIGLIGALVLYLFRCWKCRDRLERE